MPKIEWEFENAQRLGGDTLERVRARYLGRMWDLSEFMKTLKQKFTSWFNREHDRVGTLWESRFKSVIVEGRWHSLLKVAAYIDLNAVRAGIVGDPADYRWCGYSEAVAGDRPARRGLAAILDEMDGRADWRDIGPRYRKVLFGIGEASTAKLGISPGEVAKVWEAGGRMSLAQLLRCRIRYFTDGLAIGSESFIEHVFRAVPAAFSETRRSGARRMRGGEWGELRSARALRVRAIDLGGDG